MNIFEINDNKKQFLSLLYCRRTVRTWSSAATSFYDLWRVENGKVTEHWDAMETIAAKDTWQNQNGKF